MSRFERCITILCLFLLITFWLVLSTDSKPRDKIHPQKPKIAVEDITDYVDEVCINGVVYYKYRNSKTIAPKIKLEDKVFSKNGYFGFYEKCPQS